MTTIQFPKDFVWGAATAAYQIEGAANEDGRGESIWDRFSHTPGKVANGDTGDVACDHYHRWPDDIKLMQELGLDAYRFSIAWPRIIPDGRGAVNQDGLDFYSRLVDGLLEAGITPFATLFHWDLPQPLQDEGGFGVRATAEAYVDYVDAVTRHLGDRVQHWITHNEPSVFAYMGHLVGAHAPGLQDLGTALRVGHHLLLSHGMAVPVIRQNSPQSEVGITLAMNWHPPKTNTTADREAQRQGDGMWIRWFLDPLYGRGYPQDFIEDAVRQGALPEDGATFVQPGDTTTIAVITDFIGINYYMRMIVGDGEEAAADAPRVEPLPEGPENYTDLGWEVYPDGIFNVLTRVALDYQPPKMYVTENGAAYNTGPDENGVIHDRHRISYLHRHLHACQRALQNGVPLAGYFAWSLMDNFEWGEGYAQRFGITWVDYETQERTIKESGRWYARVIEQNVLPQ